MIFVSLFLFVFWYKIFLNTSFDGIFRLQVTQGNKDLISHFQTKAALPVVKLVIQSRYL